MAHIGVLIVPPIQLLDIAPVDLFSMTTKSYLRVDNLPDSIVDAAFPDSSVKISYISLSGPGTLAQSTPGLGLGITHGLDDPEVAPGKLDILMIPGPPPGLKPAEEVLEFVRKQVSAGVDLITVCTGGFVAGYAGVLDGKVATGTRGVMDLLEKEFPKVKWVDKRYVRDGRVWTSGGITNGMDLVAVYMREKWPGVVSDVVIKLADVNVRPDNYDGPHDWNN
ncbi:ThiJ/PfpI family protein [Corynespora cassiicola Philippines]|uniref:ThiJ/PfpI family protein n=1 Tax=Corynespora cassiicola Philippines TaxID=1448308 RepID=A0A2T2P3H3_CORCC|nr:ThiJ/PfpI family protein [Corynespora cassiicola Philippines]